MVDASARRQAVTGRRRDIPQTVAESNNFDRVVERICDPTWKRPALGESLLGRTNNCRHNWRETVEGQEAGEGKTIKVESVPDQVRSYGTASVVLELVVALQDYIGRRNIWPRIQPTITHLQRYREIEKR